MDKIVEVDFLDNSIKPSEFTPWFIVIMPKLIEYLNCK